MQTRRRRLPARFDHGSEELDHLDAGHVALLVVRGGQVGEEEGERGDALVQIVVEVRHLGKELLTDVISVQASTSRQDRQVR